MKRILSLLLCIALLACCAWSLASCGGDPCTEHTDADKDGKCDNCSAAVEPEPCDEHTDADGDYLCDDCGAAVLPEGPTQVELTFTVKDDEGDTLAGVTVILTHGEDSTYNVTTAASDADGKINAKIYTGTYHVSFDYDTDTLGYYLSDTSSITVAKDTAALDLLLIDNNPDGSADKPYVLSADENTVALPASTAYNYIIYRAVNLYFDATDAEGVKVTYNDTEYTADADGRIYFPLLGTDTNSVESLLIENTSTAEIEFTVTVASAPGSQGNPIIIENVGSAITTAPLGNEDIVYYSYTATVTGVFTVTVSTEGASVSMLNTRNSQSVNSASDASDGVLVLEVNEGDVILIDLSGTATGDDTATVTFTPEISEAVAW